MISATIKPLILNPAPAVHEVNGDPMPEKMARYAAEPLLVVEQRLRELDHEWEMERLTATTSGLFLLGGVLLTLFLGTNWLVLPVVIAACLLLYGLTGWRPASPLTRLLGFRTSQEIAFERYALNASRGDSQLGNLVKTPQYREDLSRFESEGGSLTPIAEQDERLAGQPRET